MAEAEASVVNTPTLPASAPPIKKDAAPFFVIGANDRPMDTRVVAIAVGVRAELKVGDREFSSEVGLHEIIALRHFYETRAGSGQVRINGGWPPALNREASLTHQDLLNELERMRKTFVTAKQGGQVVKSFEMFFGAEPADQLKRLHAIMREQYEAWKALQAVAMSRLPADTKDLPEPLRMSMACDLITEREMDKLASIADPATRGLDSIELAAIKPVDIQAKPAAPAVVPEKSLEAVKAAAEASADADDQATAGDAIAEKLASNGFDSTRALAVGALVDQYGVTGIGDADLKRVCGSAEKFTLAKKLMAG